MWLNLFLLYGIKIVNSLVIFGSVFCKFIIFSYPPFLKACSTSCIKGVQIFFYLFAWDDFFFPLVIVSFCYDSWLLLWHFDYYTLLATYKAGALNPEMPINSEVSPSISEGLKTKFSEEAASTSLKKTVYYGGTIAIIYFALIVVGIAVGVC